MCCISGLIQSIQNSCDEGSDLFEKVVYLTTPEQDYEAAVFEMLANDRSEEQLNMELEALGVSKGRWVDMTRSQKATQIIREMISQDRDSVREYAEDNGIEPHEQEPLEFWIVTDWLARKLEHFGEKVDRDFEGVAVWARTTSGQAIKLDGVIEKIAESTNNPTASEETDGE